MGYSTDIFLNETADSCICAICHDVLKDASSPTDCGHSFCTECINSLYFNSSELSCPTCRTAVSSSSNPNYAVRGIIDALDVSCPDGGAMCGWKGKVGELQSHGDICMYKVIECGIEGCTHTCQRKDMKDHRSSNEALLQHMELKYERKMNEMEAKYRRRIRDLWGEISSLQQKDNNHEMKVRTLEEKVEVLEKQIGDKKGKKRKIRSPSYQGAGSQSYYISSNPLKDAALYAIKTLGARSDNGVHISQITAWCRGYNAGDIKNAINDLSNEGHIYSTIDENNFQFAGKRLA